MGEQPDNRTNLPPNDARRSRPVGYRRFLVLAAVTVLVLGSAGTALLLRESGGGKHAEGVAFCGLVACRILHAHPVRDGGSAGSGGAQRPRHVVTRSDQSPVRRSSGSSPHSAATTGTAVPGHTSAPAPTKTSGSGPGPASGAVPAPTATPAPAAAAVTVTYSKPAQWFTGFQGQLTVANQSKSPVSGWQLVIGLPDDRVFSVWNASWQAGSSGSVVLTAAPYDQVIEPGASVSLNFIAQGSTTSPTACSFDGAACASGSSNGASPGQGGRGGGGNQGGNHGGWPGGGGHHGGHGGWPGHHGHHGGWPGHHGPGGHRQP
jgi:hypothetical protein